MNVDNESKEAIIKIDENYRKMNKMMVEEIELSSSTHSGITGNCREQMWLNFFDRIIPKKFTLAQGVIIIDSVGNKSHEVDICIYDESYTPYVFKYNNLKFIPIEAVAVVIECKSKGWDESKLTTWVDSIKALEANPTGITRMATGYSIGLTVGAQKKTTPIRMLVSLRQNTQDKTIDKVKDSFDFIIIENKKDKIKEFIVDVPNEGKSLQWWGRRLNNKTNNDIHDNKFLELNRLNDKDIKEYKTEENIFNFDYKKNKKGKFGIENTLEQLRIVDNPILTLNFQLNQLLMLINNPMLFPHYAYADIFNKIIKEKKIKGKNNI